MNRSTILRSAHPEDADAVTQVLIESRRAYLPFAPSVHSDEDVRNWVATVLIPAGGTVVCVCDGQIIGVLSTSLHDGIGWINQLYLRLAFTGRGLGTDLLAHAHAILPRPIRLFTFQDNAGGSAVL